MMNDECQSAFIIPHSSFLSAEGRGFEPLSQRWPGSALALRRDQPLRQPSESIQRRVRDSNPLDPFEPCRFSRPVPVQSGKPSVSASSMNHRHYSCRTLLSHTNVNSWTPEGVEPSSPGCRPGVLPLDDGPEFQRCEMDSNHHPRPSEGRASSNQPSQRSGKSECGMMNDEFRIHHSAFIISSSGSGRIRTCTERFLRPPPLPLGY